MKAISVLLTILYLFILGASLHAESMYFTFEKKNAEGPLQIADLTFTIDKKVVPLTEFFVVDAEKREGEILRHPAGRRQYLLVYDLVFSNSQELLKARNATAKLIPRLENSDLMALAGITRDGIHLFCSFTNDKNKMIAGLNAIGTQKLEGIVEGPEGNFYPATFSKDADDVQLIPDAQFLQNVATYENQDKKKEDQRPAFLQKIGDLAYLLSTIEGRKEVLLFSPGFDTAGMKNPRNEIEEPQFGTEDDSDELGAERMVSQGRTGPSERSASFDVQAIAGLAAGADCRFHVLSFNDKTVDFYENLTKKTNALYMDMEKIPEPSAALDQIRNTEKSFYVIGWSGNTEKEFKNLHLLKLKAGGLEISREWVAPPPLAQVNPVARKLNIAEAVYKDYEKSSYAFWTDFLLDQEVIKIPTFVQMSGSQILEGNSGKLALDFYCYVFAANGSLVDFSFTPVLLDLGNKSLTKRLSESGLKVWSILLGRTGSTTVRWIIMNRETGRVITHSQEFALDTSRLVMSHPFFPDLNLNWIVWPAPQEKHTRRGYEIQYPYKVGPDPFFPDVTPICGAKEKGRVFYLKVYNKPEANPPVKLYLINEKNESYEIDQFGLMQKPNDLPNAGMEIFWRIASFPPVNPGPYHLSVQLMDRSQNSKVTEEIAMSVAR